MLITSHQVSESFFTYRRIAWGDCIKQEYGAQLIYRHQKYNFIIQLSVSVYGYSDLLHSKVHIFPSTAGILVHGIRYALGIDWLICKFNFVLEFIALHAVKCRQKHILTLLVEYYLKSMVITNTAIVQRHLPLPAVGSHNSSFIHSL